MAEEAKEKGAEKAKKPKAEKAAGDAHSHGAPVRVKASRWTLEKCVKIARRFTNENEWKDGAPSCYKAAIAKGWQKECFAVFKSGGKKLPKSA
jgi:hypothetical protein